MGLATHRQSADCSIPVADVAREFLHTTGTLSYPTTQLSGRTGSTQSHFPQVRFWTTSSTVYNGWERYRPLSCIIPTKKQPAHKAGNLFGQLVRLINRDQVADP